MADFIHVRGVAGWQGLPVSQTSIPTMSSPNSPRPLNKAVSASALHTLASNGNFTPKKGNAYEDEEGNLSTLLDPRSRTMSPENESSPRSPSHHPDLSNEVATLSNKLINAINHQTNLDDILSATRHELEASRERVKQLEQENQEHADLLARGVLVKKTIVDAEKNALILKLANERRQRGDVEKEKKNIEQELENLTTALFEEANKVGFMFILSNGYLTTIDGNHCSRTSTKRA